jgi:hypothetical protein
VTLRAAADSAARGRPSGPRTLLRLAHRSPLILEAGLSRRDHQASVVLAEAARGQLDAA